MENSGSAPSPSRRHLLEHDRNCEGARTRGVIGVDEVGRGCIAGPVSAGAVYLPPAFLFRASPLPEALQRADDSKKVNAHRRHEIYRALHAMNTPPGTGPTFAVAHASVEEIRQHDILGATCLAMERAVADLARRHGWSFSDPGLPLFANPWDQPLILVDGIPLRRLRLPHRAIVKGDTQSLAIALASICAKHERDTWMIELDRSDSRYGYAHHKGYGTAAHLTAIREHGPSSLHRWITSDPKSS